jgi:hypothetical protein
MTITPSIEDWKRRKRQRKGNFSFLELTHPSSPALDIRVLGSWMLGCSKLIR